MKIRHERTHYIRFRCVTSTPLVTKSRIAETAVFTVEIKPFFFFLWYRTLGRVELDDVVGKNKKNTKNALFTR
jgi:hypothetical protein